ncbi:hypothetical protein NJF54_20265, partial [Pseudomonas guariconensis]|nr:hypothetical protein [Pseudomonas guariconensis]
NRKSSSDSWDGGLVEGSWTEGYFSTGQTACGDLIGESQDVCRAGETEECKRIRLTEAGNFTGGLGGGALGAELGVLATAGLCGVFSVATSGFGAPVCGIVLVGGGSLAGGLIGNELGELTGEWIYEFSHD